MGVENPFYGNSEFIKTLTEESLKHMSLETLSHINQALIHAIQSGAEFDERADRKPEKTKHLRTGINHALCICGALTEILIDAGLVSEKQCAEKRNKYLLREVRFYEQKLSQKTGMNIHLA